MKFLIVTASVGSGHIRAAEALASALKSKFPLDDIKIIDFTDKNCAFFPWLLKNIYLRMLSFLPNLYDVFYKVSEGGVIGNLTGITFSLLTSPFMHKILKREKPDMMIATHPFPEGATALLRYFGLWKKTPLAAVLTDYSLHDIWLYKNVDLYFVATEEMKNKLQERCYGKEVYALGIPVLPHENISKRDARQKLNVNPLAKVILIMGGGLGLGGIEKSLSELENLREKVVIIVVTGQNAALFSRVNERVKNSKHEMKIFSYTKEIYTLMAASDLLVTKPGALTMTEAFSFSLPMLLHEPIPGPETKNAIYAEERGAAIWVHKNESILEKADLILFNEKIYKNMAHSAKSLGKANSTEEIAACLSEYFQKKKA
ncbi:MAG: galactosyldiacylglycerol synthase [Selenomonadaceae bacterium]|nr:galactosyldiacylglycerol synthase [Selenomonadaceae bacterium]